MADDKKKTGKPDRDLVSSQEPYEVGYLAKKFDVQKVIEQEGPSRKEVEKYLDKMKKNGK